MQLKNDANPDKNMWCNWFSLYDHNTQNIFLKEFL